MKYFYRLQISFSPNKETLSSLNSILGIEYLTEDENPSEWWYKVEQNESDEYFDFINQFLNILETKYSDLEKLNIKRDDITIWMIYEYDDQCNMAFDPQRLKRIGENGITLCISCYG
ncbi:hypothetical protein [Flavobacterium sp.]|uniref:hypothetical protein n=1 Tax=Flavobacterium sp. TaxID=239 RepID=UPI002FD9EEA3